MRKRRRKILNTNCGVVANVCKLHSQEAELANIWGFKARLSYIVRPCLIESKLYTVVQSYNSKPWEASVRF